VQRSNRVESLAGSLPAREQVAERSEATQRAGSEAVPAKRAERLRSETVATKKTLRRYKKNHQHCINPGGGGPGPSAARLFNPKHNQSIIIANFPATVRACGRKRSTGAVEYCALV